MSNQCADCLATEPGQNCERVDESGVVVQCIGKWSEDKHRYLERYLAATGNVRSKFVPPRGPGGAAFVDLFAGPGRGRVRPTGQLVDGSPLIALNQRVPFSRLIFCDVLPQNVAALKVRSGSRARVAAVSVIEGDSNEEIGAVLRMVPPDGLNVALLDPYRLADLRFDTIGRLATLKRMDLIIFFPVGEIRRWGSDKPDTYGPALRRAVGPASEADVLACVKDPLAAIRLLQRNLESRYDYVAENSFTASIRNDSNTVLYHLVFASKHAKGQEIWAGVTRRSPAGQKRLF